MTRTTGRWRARLADQLEQLHLVRASLLPGESFAFLLSPEDLATWAGLLEGFECQVETADQGGEGGGGTGGTHGLAAQPPCTAHFEVRGAEGVEPWFEVTFPACTDMGDANDGGDDDDDDDAAAATLALSSTQMSVAVKGDHLDRATQTWWQTQIHARMHDAEAGFPAYAVLTELLALLPSSSQAHPSASPPRASTPVLAPVPVPVPVPAPTQYHALLTSHHLISPTKRRALAALANSHTLTGFAKLGYPGIMYAQGTRDGVEEFVREVKRWQWLALRVRCVEPVPFESESPTERWIEMTKVGEVVEWMRQRGMESLVTNLGIGAPSKGSKS